MSTKKKTTILHVKDHENGNDMLMEVDWETRKDIRVIKTKIGDKTLMLDKGDLWRALFILSKEDEQTQMIPSKLQKARIYKKRVTIEADKDIKKGEKIIFTVDWMLPEAIIPEDVLNNPDKEANQNNDYDQTVSKEGDRS